MITITCINCRNKKYIGIDDSMDNAGERMNLIDYEQYKARCCSKPDYYMYPDEVKQ